MTVADEDYNDWLARRVVHPMAKADPGRRRLWSSDLDYRGSLSAEVDDDEAEALGLGFDDDGDPAPRRRIMGVSL